jgi:hypothetical protein
MLQAQCFNNQRSLAATGAKGAISIWRQRRNIDPAQGATPAELSRRKFLEHHGNVNSLVLTLFEIKPPQLQIKVAGMLGKQKQFADPTPCCLTLDIPDKTACGTVMPKFRFHENAGEPWRQVFPCSHIFPDEGCGANQAMVVGSHKHQWQVAGLGHCPQLEDSILKCCISA